MATRTIRKMLGNLPVGVVDVVRLFVEAMEEIDMGGFATIRERSEPKNRGVAPSQQIDPSAAGTSACASGARAGSEDGAWSRNALISAFRRVVREGVKAVREAERTVEFGVAVERCLEVRRGRSRRSTLADWRSYAGRMVRHGEWAGKPLRGISVEECRGLLSSLFGHSAWSFRKGRSVLHAIFAFGVKQGWCERNPVDAIEVPKPVEQRIEPLGTEEIGKLMKACEGSDMEPAVSLMLWCGVRPGEVQRLTWGDVDVQEGVVYIQPQHSKTGGARSVPLRGKAAANFTHRPSSIVDRTCPICPSNWAKRWRELRARAGFNHWRPDTLRHTFASMHMRRFANPPMLQAEMGHRDCALLRTRYVNLRGLTAGVARKFWRI